MATATPVLRQPRSGRPRLSFSFTWWVILVVGALLVVVAGLFRSRARELERERERVQQLRCDEISRRIDSSLVSARQLTLTLAAVGVGRIGDQSGTETLLRQLMASAPDDLIYGMGLWYERGAFSGTGSALHGPYIHRARDGGTAPVLTYEWSTERYDYTGQPWYRLAATGGEGQSFTEPYVDADDVYMSSVAPMYSADGHALGVVTVDVTLSTIRNFFAGPEGDLMGEVFVTTRNGRLLFHSDEPRILAELRRRGFSGTRLLEAEPAVVEEVLHGVEPRLGADANSTTLAGWTVHLRWSGPGSLQELQRLERALLVAMVAIVLFCIAALVVVHRKGEMHRAHQAALEADLQRRLQVERWMDRRRRLLEAVVRRRTIELERLNANKDRLMSMLAHDTRGDFMVIRSYAAMLGELIDSGDEAALRDAAASLLASSNRAYESFEEILAWLDLRSGELESRPESFDVAELVANACALAEPRAKLKHIALSAAAAGHPQVLADRGMVMTILRNLLANAIKFTGAGGQVVVRAVRSSTGAEKLILEVADSGVGMSPAEIETLLQRKAVASRNGTAGERGLGLGFSICQDLCRKTGGEIAIESEKGRGTTVRFTLPLRRDDNCPA